MEKDRRLYFRAAMTLLTMLLTTATWAESAIGSIQYNSTGGYYEIGSTNNLNDLAVYVNGTGTYSTGGNETEAHDCSGMSFKLGTDIAYSHTTDWNNAESTEKNYTANQGQKSNTKNTNPNNLFNVNWFSNGPTRSILLGDYRAGTIRSYFW